MVYESYEEGDFIVIHDRQKAYQTISMAEDIEEGIVVQVKQKRAEMLICKKEQPTKTVEAKPFPPSYGSSLTVQPNETISRSKFDNKTVDDTAQDIVSDVGKYLSEEQQSQSDSLK